jgi:DNA-binding GntR family transcriptional regulator
MRTIVSPVGPYRPLYEDAYLALRDAIIDGRLAPGDRIVEAEIARQMAISRAPIREAIRKLEQDGLLEYLPRRGTVVKKLSHDEVRDVYLLRAHLEKYAARRAAARITDEDLVELANLIDRMDACAAADDLPGLIAADVQFHARICQASGSSRLVQLWESLNPHCWTLLTGIKAMDYTLSEIASRHRTVLAALQARDVDGAEVEIERHIVELSDHVLAHLSKD